VSCQGLVAFLFHFPNSYLDRSFIHAHHFMVFVLDAEGFGKGYEQMLFIKLRVALQGFVLVAFGNLA